MARLKFFFQRLVIERIGQLREGCLLRGLRPFGLEETCLPDPIALAISNRVLICPGPAHAHSMSEYPSGVCRP